MNTNTKPGRTLWPLFLRGICLVLLLAVMAGQANAITRVGATVGEVDKTSDRSITVPSPPSGTVSGDLMLLVLSVSGVRVDSIAPPPGWTQINLAAGADHGQAIFRKWASAGESGPYTFTWTHTGAPGGNDRVLAYIITYRNVNATTPVDAAGGQYNSASSTSLIAPSITTTVVNAQLVGFFGLSNNVGGGTLPASMGNSYSQSTGGGSGGTTVLSGDELRTATGATGTRTATFGSSAVSVGHLVALRPALTISVSKTFSPTTITASEASTLTITLTNLSDTAITGAAFTDTYPSNLRNTATPGVATTCTGGTATAAANGTSLALSGGTIPANSSCRVTVTVTSVVAGSYLNSTGPVTTANAGTGTAATATLTVASAAPGSFNCVEVGADHSTGRLFTKLAGTGFPFDVVALKADGSLETAYASSASKNVTVELVDGSGSAACTSRATLSPAVTQTLTFTATNAGRKSVSFTVGNAYANLRCRVTDANQTPSVVGCSSDNFAIRPSAVALNVSPAMATPPSAVASPTLKAGASFSLTGTTSPAVGYAGVLTQDTGKLTAQTTTQDATVQSGGVVGALAPASLNANASASGNASYAEAGYLYLAPGAFRDASFTSVDQPSDCVSSTVGDAHLADTLASGKYGCVIGNKATYAFGRFVPNHFDTETTNACGTVFTYSGQPFPLKVYARNAGGGTTRNYAGNFAKTVNFTDANGALGTFGTLTAGSFASGVADVLAPPQIAFTYTNKLTVPSTVRVRASDSDTSTPGSVEGTILVRSGRLLLSNAHGSELLGLPVPLEAQFWNGSGFTRNLDDACTTLNASNVQMNNWQRTLNACETSVSLSGPFVAGRGRLRLSAPGAGNSGSVNLTLNLGATGSGSTCVGGAATAVTGAAQPWLQGAWTGGSYDQNPVARASFGLHRGSKSLIYIREMY